MSPRLLKTVIAAYIAGAVISFGPIAVAIKNGTPPGPRLEERQSYAVIMGFMVSPLWPLYWSYKIANEHSHD
jgi:hypothetical protein